MPSHKRLTAYAGLLATLACLTLQARRASAEDPPPKHHCGPIIVKANDFVALNVGNPEATAVRVHVRVLNSNGGVLLEPPTMELGPGQSRWVRWPTTTGAPSQTLVRGEVVVVTGPAELRLLGTFQLFGSGSTYGPTVECPPADGNHPKDPPS